jgi:hypothetical protein
MEDEKIEISVPKGYKLIQDGLEIKFVEQNGNWDSKGKISGYYVNNISEVVGFVPFPRAEKHGNIFHKKSQAVGSLNLARLSQQLADFNKDWEPDWFDDEKTKFCIVSDFRGACVEFKVVQRTTLSRFLAFKTKQDAEEFLEVNFDEIYFAIEFI